MIDLCRLTYDWNSEGQPPSAGCYLHPQGTRGPSQRAYLIHAVRLVKSKVHPCRLALTCERIRAADIPPGEPVYPVYWYRRTRKRTKFRELTE